LTPKGQGEEGSIDQAGEKHPGFPPDLKEHVLAQIIIHAKPCTFEERAGMRTFNWLLSAEAIARKVVECKNVDQVDAAMKALSDEVGVTYPTSYFVSALLPRGERAPRGFKDRTWKIEVDRCP
jgi:hypothetical protein